MADLGGGQNVLHQLAMQQDVMNEAMKRYPILRDIGLASKHSPGQGRGNLLEFWPPGEPGAPDQPRPNEIPSHVPGVEIYSDKVRPIDVLGDVVSHHLVEADPKIKKYYENFKGSLNENQQSILQEQYQHAVDNEGEKRPYAQWEASSGLPAYFRGYSFQQWPDEFNQKAYTPEQRAMFDEMMSGLTEQKKQ